VNLRGSPVPSTSPARTLQVRHLQLARAVLAAIAAAMVTFSSDHSATYGLAVFSGFAITTGLVFLMAAWLVYPSGRRSPAIGLAVLYIIAGMVAGIPAIRTPELFFVVVIGWGVVTGFAEASIGWFARRAAREAGEPQAASEARDAITIGVLGILLAIALVFVPAQYALRYRIEEAHQTFTLTGITIGVGILGAYAAIVAVYLAIAAFTPRRTAPVVADAAPAEAAPLPPVAPDERAEGAR
jgi:hypothetical protein